MRIIPLAAVPNQSFTVTLDDIRWVVRLATARSVLVCDVTKDGVLLVSGTRALAGEPIIPYSYLETGNFIFVVNGGDLPDYRRFNISQFLAYLSAEEIAAASPVTAGDIAALVEPKYLTSDDGFYLTTDAGSILTDD